MSLRVANPTMQDWTFGYRLGELGSPKFNIMRQFSLRRGAQIELHLDEVETSQMIQQLENHGALPANSVNHSLRHFSGLIYSDLRTIAVDEIEEAHEADIQTREDRTVSEGVKSGLAFDKTARAETDDRPGALETEVTVVQQPARGSRRNKGDVKFSMTVAPDGGDDAIVRGALAA